MESPKIRNIYFKLNNYKLRNGFPSPKNGDDYFIGRKSVIDRLKLILLNSKINYGAYLVTGYRGMGKTSVVSKAVEEVKSLSEEKLKTFNFSLSQDEVKELDLLRQIAWELNQYIVRNITQRKCKYTPLLNFLFLLGSLLVTLYIFNNHAKYEFLVNPFSKNAVGYVFLFFGILVLIFSFFIVLKDFLRSLWRLITKRNYKNELITLNDELQNRLFSSLEQKDSLGQPFNLGINNPVSYLSNSILSKFQDRTKTKIDTLTYEKASPKEIEQYLIKILELLDELRKKKNLLRFITKKKSLPRFLFVIDELDKIEPDYNYTELDSNDAEKITTIQRRNATITRLLANLKNFLNTAKAKFIFIGGRDMYDAYLADIADRESFYSSIFKEVIYVPSFFKDKLSGGAGLTQITESYLCSVLYRNKNKKNKYKIIEYLKEEIENKGYTQKERFKIAHTLQNYVLYLTYRCNGSPKKLIELIESNIVRYGRQDLHQKQNKHLFIFEKKDKAHQPPDGLYLKLNFTTQYEINLHSNIYRPYTIKNSQHHKAYGDKLLYTTAFLFDHILKFHNTAFSWDNLERLPDLILADNDANFRPFYSNILNFLTHQHLRKTTNAVFQYKFNSKIANEINVCSKLSEQSSAAFNFTLGESKHLKNFYLYKISQLKNSRISSVQDMSFQELYLHSVLGDLYFYDGEYDDAITHYSTACKPLKREFNAEYTYDFETQNAIALGLCLAKNKMFSQSMAVFRATIKRCTGEELRHCDRQKQIFQRPFIAELSVFEKARQGGITENDLKRNFKEYYCFLTGKKTEDLDIFPFSSKVFSDESEGIRAHTLIADYYFSIGNILFFKNNRIDAYRKFNLFSLKSKSEKVNAASYYYAYALCTFIGFFEKSELKTGNILARSLNQIINILNPNTHNPEELNGDQYDFLGNMLTKLGDCILSSLPSNGSGDKELIKILKVFCEDNISAQGKGVIEFIDKNSPIIDIFPLKLSSVFKIYRLAYHCYKKGDKKYSAIYQYKKVLYILRDSIDTKKKGKFKFLQERKYKKSSIIDRITIICLTAQTDISEVANRRQIEKYRMQLNEKGKTNIFYNDLSTAPEIKEYVLLNQTIKIKLGYEPKQEPYIGEYSTISSMFTRVIELKYIGDKSRKRVEKEIEPIYKDRFNRKKVDDKRVNDALTSEVIEGLAYAFFAYSEILRIINIYGLNYVLNHSFKAAICEKLAKICAVIEPLKWNYEKYENLKSLHEKLEEVSNSSYRKYVDDFEYLSLAKYHYEAAKSLHSGGNQYNHFAKEMYFLNDDFNDNLTHFCTATERYRIGLGRIDKKINNIKESLEKSKLNDLSNYLESDDSNKVNTNSESKND